MEDVWIEGVNLASWKVHRVQSRWLSVCLLKGGDLL